MNHGLIFSLATLAFGSESLRNLVPALLAIAAHPQVRSAAPPSLAPSATSFKLSHGYSPRPERILEIIRERVHPLEISPVASLRRRENETSTAHAARQKQLYDSKRASLAQSFATSVESLAWPGTPLAAPSVEHADWFDVASCISKLNAYFHSCRRNSLLRRHLDLVEATLGESPPLVDVTFRSAGDVETDVVDPIANTSAKKSASIALETLLRQDPSEPITTPHRKLISEFFSVPTREGKPLNTSGLRDLLQELQRDGTDRIHSRYGTDLERSRTDLEIRGALPSAPGLPASSDVESYRAHCRNRFQKWLSRLQKALSPRDSMSGRLLESSGLWPRISARVLLEQLAHPRRSNLPPSWRSHLAALACAYVEYQGADRLLQQVWEAKSEAVMAEARALSVHHSDDEDVDHILLEVAHLVLSVRLRSDGPLFVD
jgi:hypothetical protein